MKSLIPVVVPERGEVLLSSQPVPVDPLRERGSRTLSNKKSKTWKRRSEAGKKRNVVKKRNTPKRVLTPGKDDPGAAHKKLYTRQGRKAK